MLGSPDDSSRHPDQLPVDTRVMYDATDAPDTPDMRDTASAKPRYTVYLSKTPLSR